MAGADGDGDEFSTDILSDPDGDGDEFDTEILNDLGGACEWELECSDGQTRIAIMDLREVRFRYSQSDAWDQTCLLSDFDVPSGRVLVWTPPMRLPRRDDLSSLVACLCPVDHPRREWVLASMANRRDRTEQWHKDRLKHLADFPWSDAHVLLPACPWCGLPTGRYCDGFKSFRRRPGAGPKDLPLNKWPRGHRIRPPS